MTTYIFMEVHDIRQISNSIASFSLPPPFHDHETVEMKLS